jgi:hypothetical protein
MSELLSHRAFGKLVDRSNVFISRLVKEGKLPTVDGKIPKDAGLAAFNSSQRLGYESNREHGEKQRGKSKKAAAKPVGDHDIVLPGDDEPLPSVSSAGADKANQQFNRARAVEKTFDAKIKQLKYETETGQLITVDEAKQDAKRVAAELSGLLNSIAPRIAPLCEEKPAREIEAIIDEAITEAMLTLKKSRFAE